MFTPSIIKKAKLLHLAFYVDMINYFIKLFFSFALFIVLIIKKSTSAMIKKLSAADINFP